MMGSKVARARQELLYRSPRAFKANLHSAKIKQDDGSSLKVLLCTKCLRMLKKINASQTSKISSTATKHIVSK